MRDSVIFYLSHYEVVKQLNNEQFGKLYRALFESALGNEPKIDDDIKIPFGFIKNQMVLDKDKYNAKCFKNKENGKLGGRPKKSETEDAKKTEKPNGFFENPNDNENDNDNDNEIKEKEIKRKKFIKPTINEIQDYCVERNNGINAEAFYDFYESKNWYVGKNKMIDWKACVRTWERRRTEKSKQEPEWLNEEIKKEVDIDSQNEMKEILKDFMEEN